MKVTWDDERFSYIIDGEEVESLIAKGASSSIANEFDASIRVLLDRLQQGQISAQEAYSGMKRETKYLTIAQMALARGGFDNLRPQDLERAEQIVEATWSGVGEPPHHGKGEFPGLYSFFKDIEAGRYGTSQLSSGVLARGAQYATSGRATYENERLAARMETGRMEARRIRGALDGCRDCVSWARLEWMPADVMMEKYPISASVCGGNCGCVIVTRRKANEQPVGLPRIRNVAVAAALGVVLVGGVVAGASRPRVRI